MNILALDYGKKRIGLAWADTGIGAPLPYGVIEDGQESALDQLVHLIQDEGIDVLVVGLPISLESEETLQTEAVRAFAEKIKEGTNTKIEFIDERFTSAEADRMGGEASRDEKAAMLILQSYLDKKR